jgi:hemoglobin/transferrin/lactoferrin receptor protein
MRLAFFRFFPAVRFPFTLRFRRANRFAASLVLALALPVALARPVSAVDAGGRGGPSGARVASQASQANATATAREHTLETMTVTARGVAAPVSQTPGGVGVVTAEEIAELGPTGLADAATRLPGVDLSMDSPWGAEMSIRGLTRDSVVLLIDGCRVNTATDLNGRFGLINPMDVERMEVLKGPISSLYGTGSIGGVVNVITRKGRFTDAPEWHGELRAAYSSNPQGPDTYANLSYDTPDAWLWLSGGWRDHRSYYDGDEDRVRNSGFRDFQGKVATGRKWNDLNETTLQYQRTEGREIGVPGTGSAALPVAAQVTMEESNRIMAQLAHTFRPRGALLTESTLLVSYQLIQRNQRIDNFPAASAVVLMRPAADHETYAVNWKNVLEVEAHRLVLGLDAWNWSMRSSRVKTAKTGAISVDDPIPDTDQSSLGLFAEDDWRLAPDWTLNLGLRADGQSIHNQDIPPVAADTSRSLDWDGHAGLTWAFAPGWTMTGLAAASHRSPNMLELFKNISLSGGITEVGDPSLDAEKSLFFEYGLHRTTATLRTGASLFLNYVHGYIESEPVSATAYRMANLGRARLMGAEWEAEWDVTPGWTVYANAAYTEGRDETRREPLRFVAPLNGLAGVRHEMDSGLWFALETEWAAEQRNVPEGALRTEGWATFNARCGWAFEIRGVRNELTLAAENLANAHYRNHLATSRGIELYDPGLNVSGSWRMLF